MAGDWIPITSELPKRIEVIQLSKLTGRNRREVVGILIEFWIWAQQESVDGFIPITVDVLSDVVRDTDRAFWDSMIKVGWLEAREAGVFIPRAEKWITKGAKSRAALAMRQSNHRSRNGSNADVTKNRDKSVTNRTEQNRTEDLSRSRLLLSDSEVPKNGKANPNDAPTQPLSIFGRVIPAMLKDDEQLMAWFDWVVHDRKDPIFDGSDRDRELVLAGADLALRKCRGDPMQYFSRIVGGKEYGWIKPLIGTAARNRLKAWKKSHE